MTAATFQTDAIPYADFEELGETFDVELVDLDDTAWQNDEDKIVFRVGGMPFVLAMEFAAAVANLRPDYTDLMEVEGHQVFRLWWD